MADQTERPAPSQAAGGPVELQEQVRRLELLNRIGVALSAEKNKNRLVETILLEAKALCRADGGTVYLRTDDDRLRFDIMHSDTLGIALGGTTGRPIELPAVRMYNAETGEPNEHNVASYCATHKCSVNIPDAYSIEDEFDFSGTEEFDRRNNYRSTSFLTIPLVNSEDRVIGVLQLLNARNEAGEVVPFSETDQQIVESLASQAAIALDNKLLLDGQRELLESFIKLIAAAIDAKSPYTGGHCERVPVLTEMLARAACDAQDGPLGSFDLDEDEWYELRIAAWLHDCGKVVTPVHVMDKSTKLETISDRMATVRARFEVLEREAKLRHLEARLADPAGAPATAELEAELTSLREDLAFLERANVGGEFLSREDQERIRSIGARPYTQGGETTTLLTDDEVANLVVSRGTLTDEERLIINGHMVHTLRMLQALPFPRNLRRVPEYAGGHHEKMDGSGYPRGLWAGDMSIPARIMAIADVFEALTAQDRPYKRGKTLSESMEIMGKMKEFNHLDPDLFDLFVRSGVYREYGSRFLPPELMDEVDEAALIAIEPRPYELADERTRAERWRGFLPEYADQVGRIPQPGGLGDG